MAPKSQPNKPSARLTGGPSAFARRPSSARPSASRWVLPEDPSHVVDPVASEVGVVVRFGCSPHDAFVCDVLGRICDPLGVRWAHLPYNRPAEIEFIHFRAVGREEAVRQFVTIAKGVREECANQLRLTSALPRLVVGRVEPFDARCERPRRPSMAART